MAEPNEACGAAILALAGRRIDAPGTDPPRFPLERVPLIRERIDDLLAQENATALVCSAACGADLVALEAAERLGIRRRIVLPFAPERFRETSVTDRPGVWGPVFDRLIEAAAASGDLVVLQVGADDGKAYAAANEAIISEGQKLSEPGAGARPHRLLAIIVWEGAPREGDDATSGFRELAWAAGFEERIVLTL
jgi:hypothetical protein